MIQLQELHQIHVKAFKDLDRYESILDRYIKQAWERNPLGQEFTFSVNTSEITKEHLQQLYKKYQDNGWVVNAYSYPQITVSVLQPQKFVKAIKELMLEGKEVVAKPPRAIKLVRKSIDTMLG